MVVVVLMIVLVAVVLVLVLVLVNVLCITSVRIFFLMVMQRLMSILISAATIAICI